MNDLIDRQAALNPKFDVISPRGTKWIIKETINAYREYIAKLPSAEPQIIRCKDCRYWDTADIHSTIHPNCRCKATVGKLYTDESFFCGYAGRRQDEAH